MAVENMDGAQTTTYTVEFAHSRSEGIIALPVAGEEQLVSLARLHSPFEYLSVYWTAVSQGKPPILPSHLSYISNGNRVFLGGERHGLVFPDIAGHIWQAAGVFHYVICGPESISSDFPLAMVPWESTPTDFYIPAGNFVTGLINPATVTQPNRYNGDVVTYPTDDDAIALNNMLR